MEITSSHVFVPVIESKDYGSVGIDGDSINTGQLHRLAIALTFGTITGDSVLTLYAGATAGAKTTALAFKYRIGSADFASALADQLGAPAAVTSAGLTLTAATFDHRLVTIDVDPSELPINKPWLTLSISNVATVLNLGAIGVAETRYAGATMPSVI